MPRTLFTVVITLFWCAQVVSQELTPVATAIEMHPDKMILAGDDMIVFGIGGFSGVDFIVPSAGDKKGRGIPDGDSYNSGSFAVAGKKVALVKDFQVTIFDTESGLATPIPIEQIRLTTVPSRMHDKGHMQSSRHFIVCRSDRSTLDECWIKLIDVRPNPPSVISFEENPPLRRADFINHVLVNAESNQVVAATSDSFFVYDISRPTADPVQIEVDSGIADIPPQLDDDFLLYQDREAYPNTCLLQVSSQKVTRLKPNPSSGLMRLKQGSFAYFRKTDSDDSVGNGIRSVRGGVLKPDLTLSAPKREWINGRTSNHGAQGYGETLAFSNDGKILFLAGTASPGAGEYLQIHQGNEFQRFPDPLGKDPFGCLATDISVHGRTVAFKTLGTDHRTVYVGYLLGLEE